MTGKVAETVGVGLLIFIGSFVWGAVVWSQSRRKKPPPRWIDVPPPKRPWPKDK